MRGRKLASASTIMPAPAVDDAVRDAIDTGAWVVFSLSGGKDSTASAVVANNLLDRLGHPRTRRLCIHADLGRGDWALTGDTVQAVAAWLGLPLIVVRHGSHDMISRWRARFDSGLSRYAALETLNLIGPWSSARLRFCTSEMKAAVITAELMRRLAGRRIISVVGLRRAESVARRATPISREEERYRRRDGTSGLTWHPGVDWSADQVFALHRTLGLPLHEAYSRYGTSRLSCRVCILASLADLRACASAPSNGDVYRLLVTLEARSTFSFQPGRWLGSVAPDLLGDELACSLALGQRRAEERRALEATLPPNLRYVKGWPPRLPTHEEACRLVDVRRAIADHHRLAISYTTPADVIGRFAELMGPHGLPSDCAAPGRHAVDWSSRGGGGCRRAVGVRHDHRISRHPGPRRLHRVPNGIAGATLREGQNL